MDLGLRIKVIRTSTIPISLNVLLKGQLRFLSQYFEVIGISSSGQILEELKAREGVDVQAVEMQRGISLYRDIISLLKLYLIFKKERPIIVHSITPKAGLLTMLAGKMAGVPIRVHTFTGLIFPSKTGMLQKILILMDQLLCWSATHVYPEGLGVKNDLITYKITGKPLRVIANGNVNGIDTAYFDKDKMPAILLDNLRQSLGINTSDFVFVFVGRLVGDKGINELIKAFSRLSTTQNHCKLLLVGPFENDLDPLENETTIILENNPRIISVGFQQDVRPYLAISHVLTFPSYREGFPNVVMQAGAMGLPSIVSNINGCNEIIVEGQNGTIIPVKSEISLYVSMEKMLENTDYYNHLQGNARSMITSRYEQEVVWKALLEEYRILLRDKGLAYV